MSIDKFQWSRLFSCSLLQNAKSIAPPTVGNTTRCRLRNESDLQTIPTRSKQYYNSFLLLPSVTLAWNGLSEDKKNSILAFKRKFKSHLNTTTLVTE